MSAAVIVRVAGTLAEAALRTGYEVAPTRVVAGLPDGVELREARVKFGVLELLFAPPGERAWWPHARVIDVTLQDLRPLDGDPTR